MDKRIAKALKVLVFNPVLLEAQHNLKQVEEDLETLKGQTLSEEEAQAMKGALGLVGRFKSSITLVNEAMDACDEEVSDADN